MGAILGDTNLAADLRSGMQLGSRSYKVHLDGYDLLPYLTGKTETSPRESFFYFSDTGDLLNLRFKQYKIVFAEQRAHGFDVWSEPFVFLRFPKLFNLRADPFEHADEIDALGYQQWRAERMYALVPAQAYVAEFLSTFREFPPRQKPSSFSIDQVLERMQSAAGGGGK